MRVVLAGMRLISVKEDRSDPLVGVALRDRIHGWRRHPAVGSGEATELDDRVVVARPDCTETRLIAIQVPERKVRRALAERWAGIEVHPGLELFGDEPIVVVAGEQISVSH